MANNGAPAVLEADGMLEEHGPNRGQWDRPETEGRVPLLQTAREASGDRESGEFASPPASADGGPRAGQRAGSGSSDLMWESMFAAMQATRVGEHYDVNSAVRAPVSLEERESRAVDKWLTKCKIDKPNRFSGESAGCGEHVKSFLSEVKRYFAVTGLPVSSWGVMSAHFLKGAALLSWELELLCLLKAPMLCHGTSLSTSCLIALACCSLRLRFALPMMLWCSLTMTL